MLEEQLVALLAVDGDVREEGREPVARPARAREEERGEARAGVDGQRGRGEVGEQRDGRVCERVEGGEEVALNAQVRRRLVTRGRR